MNKDLPPKLIQGKVWVPDAIGGYRRLPENDYLPLSSFISFAAGGFISFSAGGAAGAAGGAAGAAPGPAGRIGKPP